MKFADLFKGNKGSWALTGLLIILLMAVAAAPDIWTPTVPADGVDNNGGQVVNGDGQLTTEVADEQPTSQPEDGSALPDDLDNTLTQLQQPAETASSEPLVLVMPLAGSIGRNYGYGFDPTYNDYRFHHGVDLMAEPGTPVYAAAAGEVIISRDDSYWGGIVTIQHADSWQSVYCCLTPSVSVGDQVAAGTVIGNLMEKALTESGQETHLHFELYLDGQEENPEAWL